MGVCNVWCGSRAGHQGDEDMQRADLEVLILFWRVRQACEAVEEGVGDKKSIFVMPNKSFLLKLLYYNLNSTDILSFLNLTNIKYCNCGKIKFTHISLGFFMFIFILTCTTN